MFALLRNNYHMLYLVFFLLNARSLGFKNYHVKRVNESVYIVTVEQESGINTQLNRSLLPKEHLTDKKFPDNYDDTVYKKPINVAVPANTKKGRTFFKVTAPFIAKARENYFRNFYSSTNNKPTNTNLLSETFPGPSNITDSEKTGTEENYTKNRFNNHLMIARKLAAMLLKEVEYHNDLKGKEKFIETFT